MGRRHRDYYRLFYRLYHVFCDKNEYQVPPAPIDEATFRWEMNQNAMATEKLAEGIRNFAIDQQKLENMLADRL